MKEKIALAYFARNENLYVDMSECVLRGDAEMIDAGQEGVLLYDRKSCIYMLAAEEERGAEALLKNLDEDHLRRTSGLLVAHGDAARRAAHRRLKTNGETVCYQVVYRGELLPLTKNLRFRLPDREEREIIKREYHLESPEHIEQLCDEEKIYCGFEGKSFVGFIGRHPEGSMGLLHVFSEHRRKGYGEELEKFMIDLVLREGRVPYAHIITDNAPSIKLQRKLNYQFADRLVYWIFDREQA